MTPLRRLLARQLLSIQIPLVAILLGLVWWGSRTLLLGQAQRDGEARLRIAVQAMDQRLTEVERGGSLVHSYWTQGRLPFDAPEANASLLMPWLHSQDDFRLLNFLDEQGHSLLLMQGTDGWHGRVIRRVPGGSFQLGWQKAGALGLEPPAPGTYRDLDSYDPRSRPWYREARGLETPRWSVPYRLGPPENRLVMTWLVPLRRPGKPLEGALGLDLVAEDLQGFLELLRPTQGSRLWLLDQEGQVLSDAHGSQAMVALPPPGSTSALLGGLRHRILRSELPRHPGSQWHMVLAIPEADLLATAQGKLLGFTAAAFVVMLLPILWGLRVGRRLSDDIQDLANAAGEVGAGVAPHRPSNEVLEFQVVGQALQWAHAEIRERHALQEQLQHSQRLETLGTLAGGIAHDVNNHLSAILGQMHLVRETLPDGHPAQQRLILAESSATSCARTTRTLLAFSRHGDPDLRPMDLHELVAATADLLGCILGGLIQVNTDLASGPAPIKGDHLQLEQVLMNLAVNARDAMPQGGQLTLRTRRTREGRIELEVEDTGQGIPGEALPRIFEPFFTTKAVGQGTGLGLSMVHGIVQTHGGTIAVDSQVGTGTRFTLSFPLAECGGADSAPRHSGKNPIESLLGLRILVAEDEIFLLDMLESALVAAGAHVSRAASGDRAWEAFQIQAFDLVLSDQRMPGCTGMELFQRIRATGSRVPFILASGQSLEAFQTPFAADARAHLLNKPFAIDDLLTLIRGLTAH
ncbi:MAG: response regulator [Geothrix sp.]|uniref:hybrid sensor histidine kinase/response regulator n=1 Tax=Geothrix sp. TaxID=1962974 RepID=UPI00180F12AB|nr:ATP-binding protein [Geothrix sp.]NWJ40384.1 response regulator [Geothrix sp.]WIL21611.1 MAG: ATP-binding protein [Geothrix sp.]